MTHCKICGEWNCEKHNFKIGKIKKIDQFSGSSPPEIFVGRWNYPNVYTGILSPQEYGDKQILSSPELWHKNNLSIKQITSNRNELIYGRTQNHIKKRQTKFLDVLKEVAMTHKSVAIDFKLKKKINSINHPDKRVPLISKAAPVQSARLEENTKIKSKVDYLVNDTDVKSTISMQELYKSGIQTSNIIKLLSAGLLGLKKNRKLVPTRWSITATDDTLSKQKLPKIKLNSTISEFQVFHSEYLGNHYEFLLLPDKYSFEVIEMHTNYSQTGIFWQDYESFFPRKKYADNVTGGYYAVRLPLTEHLEKIKRQAQCLVIREVKPEYNVPCGVGILRETSRDAFSKKPEKFNTLKEALDKIQTRLTQPITNYTTKSQLLKNFGKQKRLNDFI